MRGVVMAGAFTVVAAGSPLPREELPAAPASNTVRLPSIDLLFEGEGPNCGECREDEGSNQHDFGSGFGNWFCRLLEEAPEEMGVVNVVPTQSGFMRF